MTTILIYLIFLGLYLLLVQKSGKTYPLIYLFFFTYFLQYIFSTYLIYNNYDELEKQMVINQEEYFKYAVPAIIFLFAGMFLFNKDYDLTSAAKRIEPAQASQLGYLLIIISYSFDFASLFGLGLGSIASFTHYLKYVGAFCFLFSNSIFNFILIAVIFLGLVFDGLASTIFIEVFAWCTYLFFFVSLRFDFSFWKRSTFIFIAAPILILIHSVKNEIRDITWKKEKAGGIALYADLLAKKSQEGTDQPFAQTEGVVNTVGRLSQGWHLGLTMKHVPRKEPFADGQDFLGDIEGSFLPRVFFQDKKVVGSQNKFLRYTGRRLHGNTSMTIGLLGDFYVNFGRWGSYIMLFVFGAFIAKMLSYFIKRFVLTDPINLVWIPFILSYLVLANNDFYIVFNNLIKGFVVFLVVSFLRRVFFTGNSRIQTT